MPFKIFFCYAHEDEQLLNKLKNHLFPLKRTRLIDVWHDRDISAGTDWEQQIKSHLNQAQIILLLVSPDFMVSDYCYSIEMQRALERHDLGEARVIPIILRYVYWQGVLGKLQALPTDARPIKSWPDLDEALYNVTEGIRKVIQEITPKSSPLPPILSTQPVSQTPLPTNLPDKSQKTKEQWLEEGHRFLPLPSCGAWSIVSSPSPGSAHNQLNSVAAVSANDMWAVGGYSSTVNGPFQPLIEHWNGSSWSVVEGPKFMNASLGGIVAISAHDIWAVGKYTIGGASQPLIEHWNGSSWSVVKSPLLPSGQNSLSFLNSVVVVSPRDIWAVGYFFLEPPAFKFQTLIEHWNGSSWSIVKSPNPWSRSNELNKVVALSANDIWAVGIYNTDSAVTKPLIEHWNGSSWSVVTSPSVKNTYLADVVRVPHTGKIWAVGSSFSQFGGNSWQTIAEVYC